MRDAQANARPSRKHARAVLDAAGLRLQRGRTLILRDISWRVSPGEHWVILGPNGSGKTSLLGALTGYVTPTAGTIVLLGQRYGRSDWRELRKQIGIVSSSVRQMMANDEPAIETVISGKYAMIDFWGRPSRGDRVRAQRILRQIECSHLADRPWLVLSQGERQRVLIGRALMGNPRMLILDEPCAGLDPAAREHFLNFLQRLGSRRNSPTLVLVTHHVEEIMPVFSHVLVLKAGVVLASGTKQSVLRTSVLAKAFNARLSLKRAGNRYALSVQRKAGALM